MDNSLASYENELALYLNQANAKVDDYNAVIQDYVGAQPTPAQTKAAFGLQLVKWGGYALLALGVLYLAKKLFKK